MPNSRKRDLFDIVWFSTAWGLCSLFILAGTVVLIMPLAQQITPKENNSIFMLLAIVLIAAFIQLFLAGLFIFQIYLFSCGTRAVEKGGWQLGLSACAFSVIYGFIGATLVLHGLRYASEGQNVLKACETVLGLLSLAVWTFLMLLHRKRTHRSLLQKTEQ